MGRFAKNFPRPECVGFHRAVEEAASPMEAFRQKWGRKFEAQGAVVVVSHVFHGEGVVVSNIGSEMTGVCKSVDANNKFPSILSTNKGRGEHFANSAQTREATKSQYTLFLDNPSWPFWFSIRGLTFLPSLVVHHVSNAALQRNPCL